MKEKKDQKSTGSFEEQNPVDKLRNHTPQQETYRIQGESEPK